MINSINYSELLQSFGSVLMDIQRQCVIVNEVFKTLNDQNRDFIKERFYGFLNLPDRKKTIFMFTLKTQ